MRSKHGRNRKEHTPSLAAHDSQPKLSRILDIPMSATPGLPQLELAGNREAVVDGCQGILEYDENVIKLTTGKMGIRFTGRDLQVKVLTHDSAVVTGFIKGIEFIS